MNKIIRTENKTADGLSIQYVFGMGIFHVKELRAKKPLEQTFLEFVNRDFTISVHTGMLFDVADDPEELFGKSGAELHYDIVSVGIFGGGFYSYEQWPRFQPCFFPEVSSKFWHRIETNFREIIGWDAIAAYVYPRDSDFSEQMKLLFEEQFVSSDDWIKKALDIYRLVIVPVDDAYYLQVFTKDPKDFALLDKSLQMTEEFVASSEWYKENKEFLTWDGDRKMCLVRSEQIKK